ncbi:ATP-binding protein [Streptomyces prunicolor]|uniref:ATP-binding protein n=1 Tax=Streptomyces prunicolor TaxID=67348 RepID=UPI002259938A|nr:ATP-binding protein [Streptomyces prunicolor]MCX5238418.1 ATP-binding protein [Streptomyces prunicolor]
MNPADIVHPIPLLAASLRLTAESTAVGHARMFVRHTLDRWQLTEEAENATLIMSELVTNAIKASGLAHPDPKPWQIKDEHVIGVQLQVVHGRLFTEVWDRTPETPVRQNLDFNATSGRGLLLVESVAEKWGVYRPHVGGKVVWAELPVELPTDSPPFDLPNRPLLLPAGVRAPRGSVELQARQALLDRLTVTTLDRRR